MESKMMMKPGKLNGPRTRNASHAMMRGISVSRVGLQRIASALALIALVSACTRSMSDGASDPAARRTHLAKRVAEARRNLAQFYMTCFPVMIEGEAFSSELPVTRFDYFAHRLWVPDRDASYEAALRALAAQVSVIEIEEVATDGTKYARRAARFVDEDQLHRDQYAMILSEMGIERLGPATLAEFLAAAEADYGAFVLSGRTDHPWSAALLATHHAADEKWKSATGKRIDVGEVFDQMLGAPFLPHDRDEFACYDFHTVYALAAATASGHEQYAPATRRMMSEALSHAGGICAASLERGDEMEEIIGRIKLNGHLLEAFFRARAADMPLEDYEDEIGEVVEGLVRDSAKIRLLIIYEGPPNIFVSVPHAIHGLDLAARRLENPRAANVPAEFHD